LGIAQAGRENITGKKHMTKIMDGVTEYEEGMEVKLVYQKDRHTKKERYMVLAMNEAGHCCTRVDLIQLLDWVKINKPELMNHPWVGPLYAVPPQLKEDDNDGRC